ncbi:hypothetical protein [Gryllotalpicola protaetiae]|uniref:hypothetical protein n=1 Tax=Gryllotalpicola protaetiae TaxID=2419771 RepID=UPI0013C50E45|nr:hypothetical protein [Gryllotalpicola protaetiae]
MYATAILTAASSKGCTDSAVICAAKGWASAVGNAANNVGNAISGAASTAKDVANGVQSVTGFWSDPWGNTFKTLQTSAESLATKGLNGLSGATLPDLTAHWWVQSYAVSFAIAMLVMCFVLIPAIVRTARGHMAGGELAELLGVYLPLFVIGCVFGPLLGTFIIKLTGALTDSITNWGVIGSASDVVDGLNSSIKNADPGQIIGGAAVAVFMMLGMVVGLFLVFVMLIIQLITLYFLGAVMPLGYVWILDERRRQFGMKIIWAWLGILLSHPLIFLLLGFAYLMIQSGQSVFSSQPTLQSTVQLFVDAALLLLVGASPMFLGRLAPVIPSGGVSQNSGQTFGKNSLHEADNDAGTPSSLPSSTSTNDSSPSSSTSTAAPSSTDASSSTSDASLSDAGAAEDATSSAAGKATGAGGAGAAEGAGAAAGAAEGAELAEAAGATAATDGAAPPLAAAALGAQKLHDQVNQFSGQVEDAVEAPVRDHDSRYGRDSV